MRTTKTTTPGSFLRKRAMRSGLASNLLKSSSSTNTAAKSSNNKKRRQFAIRFCCCFVIIICMALLVIYFLSLAKKGHEDFFHHPTTKKTKATTTTARRRAKLLPYDVTKNKRSDNNNRHYNNNDSIMSSNDDEDPEMRKMTVLITTFKQPFCLLRQLSHLQKCGHVLEAIHVNWFDGQGYPPPNVTSSLLSYIYQNATTSSNNNSTNNNRIDLSVPVIFDKLPNRLSYRFYPRPFPTKAVFNIDVDTGYSCEALELAFHTWKKQNTNNNNMNNNNSNNDIMYYSTPVGFHPRYLPTQKYYHWRTSYVFPHLRNTIFITKGAIIHRDVFEYYFSSEFSKLRELVDILITGEDMLMSFVLSDNYNRYKYYMDMKKTGHNASSTTQTIKPSYITICHDSLQGCEQKCKGVKQLKYRSGSHRPNLLKHFFRFFGNDVFENTTIAFGESLPWWREYILSFASLFNNNYQNDITPFLEKNTSSSMSMVWQEKNNGTVIIRKQLSKSDIVKLVPVCGSYERAPGHQRCGNEYFDFWAPPEEKKDNSEEEI